MGDVIQLLSEHFEVSDGASMETHFFRVFCQGIEGLLVSLSPSPYLMGSLVWVVRIVAQIQNQSQRESSRSHQMSC